MRSNMGTKQVAQRSSLGALQRRSLKRKKSDQKLSRSIKKIRADMVEISEGQKRIREGQMEVREKFQEISKEAAKLKEETSQISKQSAANQLRLDLMFQIVKARAENDFAKDDLLTQTLRFGSNGKAEHQQNPGSLGRTMLNNPS
ncbi:hypothetical protein POPTR_001G078100v4 [Populus trichocarpa]|uniref:Uncharacterized protein n=1 Tax=Populus trichocarpa TaxID=3694 RepID=A0ACC0THN3_POPTR|nr:hypothetical protein POPTR_001G078100v4 [Populus trichocarpa]